MKRNPTRLCAPLVAALLALGCNNAATDTSVNSSAKAPAETSAETSAGGGQSAVADDQSQKDVVKIAMASADHSTLVKALQQAEYVNALSNAGPFTVFAPTNAAFDKLPAGTLESLMKEENRNSLRNILEYHVYIGVLKPEMLQDGQQYGEANGNNIKIGVKDGQITINGTAKVLATVPASNGIIYVLDEVLLPPSP